jgi:hypothetical protein
MTILIRPAEGSTVVGVRFKTLDQAETYFKRHRTLVGGGASGGAEWPVHFNHAVFESPFLMLIHDDIVYEATLEGFARARADGAPSSKSSSG